MLYICADSKKVYPNDDDEDVEEEAKPSFPTSSFVVTWSVLSPTHPQIGNPPKDPAEE